MKTTPTFLLLLALALGAAPAPAAAQEHGHHHPVRNDTAPASAEEQAVRAAVEGFSGALEAGDSLRALTFLHPEVVVYEGGHAETLSEYRSGHLRADIAFLQAVEQKTLRDQVVLEGDVALYLSEYHSKGSYRGREIDSHGTETLALVRTPAGWKIRHIHWSSSR